MRTATRVVVCSIVAAAVWLVLIRIAFPLVGGSFFEGVLRGSQHPESLARFIAVNVGPAVWAILLYWGLEKQYGTSALNFAKAGGGWWLISTLIQAKWYGFGVIRLPEDYGIATMFTTLVAAMVATYAGAWLFDSLERG